MPLRDWARALKREVLAVWLASRDPRVPWYVKALAIIVAGYALSPIDLIPDVIPILGYLDDVLLVPAGIWLVVRLIPPALMAEFRAEATKVADRPVNRTAAIVIVVLWAFAALLCGWLLYNWFVGAAGASGAGVALALSPAPIEGSPRP
jgi:uncharacterized membrane protein YkvA (DUF1232 family)